MPETRVYSIARAHGPSRLLSSMAHPADALRWAHRYCANHPGALLLILEDSPQEPILVAAPDPED